MDEIIAEMLKYRETGAMVVSGVTLQGDREKYQMSKRRQLVYLCIKVKVVKRSLIIIE